MKPEREKSVCRLQHLSWTFFILLYLRHNFSPVTGVTILGVFKPDCDIFLGAPAMLIVYPTEGLRVCVGPLCQSLAHST